MIRCKVAPWELTGTRRATSTGGCLSGLLGGGLRALVVESFECEISTVGPNNGATDGIEGNAREVGWIAEWLEYGAMKERSKVNDLL